ncbi:MAG: hypothetical protein AUG51_16250 [Acidobacteria bacterium 13_1_20CM_3_53_8]|nr:MAG: hypothetical protein AUG51_16250 [Acidobacteria bacterium 13_1_20CM_3_53_8]
MPNASGSPTYRDVRQWSIDEQQRHQRLEYNMPQDRDKVISDFCKRATLECMQMCAYGNRKLDKQEIAIKSKFACEQASAQTKCMSFTNYYHDFEKTAKATYEKAYSCAQNIFSRNFRLLEQMQLDTERYSFDSAYSRIQREVEHFVCFSDYGKGFNWYGGQ